MLEFLPVLPDSLPALLNLLPVGHLESWFALAPDSFVEVLSERAQGENAEQEKEDDGRQCRKFIQLLKEKYERDPEEDRQKAYLKEWCIEKIFEKLSQPLCPWI